jgi:type IV pilus assembly protein PilC
MAKFKYYARTQEGELQTGFVEAFNREGAANILTSHNLFILSLESAEQRHWFSRIANFLNRVKIKDLVIFTRQFATLMESKMPLVNSIEALYQQTKNPLLKEAIFEIASDVDSGLSLSQAMERQKQFFSEFYISMIRNAEITGQLEEAITFLADYLEKELMWRSRVRNALIYPSIVVVLFLVVAGVMLTVVFPKIGPVFEETGTSLPLVTQIFLSAGNFILQWWWAIIIILILLVFLLIDYFQSHEGKAVFNELIINVPLLGELFKKIYVAQFTEAISVLVKGGIPITQAIEIAGRTIGNVVYRDILNEMADKVRAGELFSNLLFQNEYYFPALVAQMVAIGEKTGRLDEVLSRISNFYTREVNDLLSNLVELIQPLLIAVIGAFVGLLFASVLIPIYNLAQAF